MPHLPSLKNNNNTNGSLTSRRTDGGKKKTEYTSITFRWDELDHVADLAVPGTPFQAGYSWGRRRRRRGRVSGRWRSRCRSRSASGKFYPCCRRRSCLVAGTRPAWWNWRWPSAGPRGKEVYCFNMLEIDLEVSIENKSFLLQVPQQLRVQKGTVCSQGNVLNAVKNVWKDASFAELIENLSFIWYCSAIIEGGHKAWVVTLGIQPFMSTKPPFCCCLLAPPSLG